MKYILLIIFSFLSVSCQSLPQRNQNIQVEVLTKTTTSWDGTPLRSYATSKPEITILKITIPPKAKLALHKHPVINAGVLLKGRLTVVTELNEILHLNAGDSIVEVVNKWHHGQNESSEQAVIILFYAGTVNQPITIKY